MASNGHHRDIRPSSRTGHTPKKPPVHSNPLLADAARLVQQRQQAAQQTPPAHASPSSPPHDDVLNKRKHSPIPWPEPGAKAARTVTFASPSRDGSQDDSAAAPSRSGFSSRWGDDLDAPEQERRQESPEPAPGPSLPDDGVDPALVYGEVEVDQEGSEEAAQEDEPEEPEEPEEPPIPVRWR